MDFPFLSSDRVRPTRPYKRVLRPAGKPDHLLLGLWGEQAAAEYLRSIGYSLREKNSRQGRGEIDLIAWDPVDKVLVFVEVKTRTEKTRDGFQPEMTAAAQKRRILRRSVRRWVASHNYDGGYRIDLICIQEGKVTNHFKELAWD